MGWIGIMGGNAVNVKRKPKQPFTPKQYAKVLGFFQQNAGNFYTVADVNEKTKIESERTTKAIIDDQVADPRTGVQQDPRAKGKYGIPKKGKK